MLFGRLRGLAVKIDLNERAWKAFGNALDPKKFKRAIKSGIKMGLRKAAKYLAKNMKSAINKRVYTANRAFTIALKLHAKPVVGRRSNRTVEHLIDTIGYLFVSDFEVHIGAVRSSVFKGRRYNIAEIVHDGCIIKVTPKMAFWLATAASRAGGRMGVDDVASAIVRQERKRYRRDVKLEPGRGKVYPLFSKRGYLVIPKRPWLVNIFKSKIHQKEVGRLINESVIRRLQLATSRNP